MSRAQNIGWSQPATAGDPPPRAEKGALLLVLTPWTVDGRKGLDTDVYEARAWGLFGETPSLRWVQGGAALEWLRAGARYAVVCIPRSA